MPARQPFDSTTTTPRLSMERRESTDQPDETADMKETSHPSLEGDDHDKETDVESAQEPLSSSEKPADKDPNLVEWDGPDDPGNPQNFSRRRKWLITVTMSTMTMWITFASSVFSTATMVTAKEFGVSTEVMTLGTSLTVFGFALGPLFWAPLSELYGRRLPLFSGYAVFAIFQIPVAVAQNIQTIMVCRFLVGVFGCSPLAVVGGAMADLWNPIDRAVAIAMFSSATFLGPVLGPIIGGFLTDSYLGWRWTAWITLITSSFFGLLALFIVPETYAPKLLQQRAARLRRETKNWALHSFLDEHEPSLAEIGQKYLLRPLQMLVMEPILICMTIYLALVYGILYLFFEAYPISFNLVRGWTSLGVAALPFIGIMIGVLFGAALIIYTTKTRFARKLAKHGKVVPEERLVPMMVASVLLHRPIGSLGLNYIIDVYMMFANSAIAANTLIRSALGGAFPLFATQMYTNLGVDWASSVLGFITIAMIPIPILFFFYGARIRAMSRFTPKF
ncbi:Citrinin biosynthesis cluster MFS transporter mrr1 [Penicillium oxalicum]|uniref:Citrinin biosynthesis cluster MFS transporter mrr1 n=1 Tax=Penicillium oxalicum TaxID=69781 RepID=UPI0020B71001|nr:Citrinin biosynthesis cluster MFS transporter mrr1 [Penicillium oxalicum]KAI2789497.1 Citrinin biosynthesis cluster MFS transporter mrr1 [Penicillium oxalicum]